MRSRLIFIGAVMLPFVLFALIAAGARYRESNGIAGGRNVAADAVEKIKESRASNQKLLVAYDHEQSQLRLEVIKRRRLYQDGQVGREEVQEAERSLVSALSHFHEVSRLIMEADLATTEATLGDELRRLPAPGVDGYSATENLALFHGGAKWSLNEAPRIEKFFFQTYGRNLPVTAFGQTTTHERMRFDHRDAMDVALHPDSAEGKGLIDHLRRAGIPFIVFRNAVAGASTGPHIHIGAPSHAMGK
jgi:hypothetical protein